MGDWNMQIVGTGIHHNGVIGDADQVFKRLHEELTAAGHQIHHASITFGGRLLPAQVQPLKEEPTPTA